MTRIESASRTFDRRPPARQPKGRVCARDGCRTILDPYNQTAHCGAHQPEPDNVYCGYTVLVCGACGETVAVSHPKAARSRRCGACGTAREEEVTPMNGGSAKVVG